MEKEYSKCHKYKGFPNYIDGHNNAFKNGTKIGIKTRFKKNHKLNCGINHPNFEHGLWIMAPQYYDACRNRGLGFIPMNKPFQNCRMHHLDRWVVMFIPRDIHELFKHSVKTGENLDKMNELAYEWFDKQITMGR